MNRHSRHHFHKNAFTLMEIVIATVILGLSVVATMAIIAGAQSNLLRAENRWSMQHITSSVVEYYLMAGHKGAVPRELLPQGFSATCELLTVDDIHEDAQEPISEWILGEYLITIFDTSGDVVSETRVRKLVKEADFE